MSTTTKAKTGAKHVTYYMTPKGHYQLKLLALEGNTSMKQLIDAALQEYFARRALPELDVAHD